MVFSENSEDLIIRWIFAETVRYKNRNRSIIYPKAWLWASHTRIQKILFSVFEEFDIPITRSWYMWGGFVHSDTLGEKFNYYRANFSKHPERALNLRKKAINLDLPIKEIINSVERHTDEVVSIPSKQFLPLFYKRETPEEFRNLYISKHNIADFLHRLKSFKPNQVTKIKNTINQTYDAISDFHMSSLMFIDDMTYDDLNLRFAELIESSFDKLILLITEKEKISKLKLSFYSFAENVFNYYIWKPYACRISQLTLKGIRLESEKEKMKYIEKTTIDDSHDKLDKLSNIKDTYGLSLSWEELQKFKKIEFENKENYKILSEVIGIYDRSQQEGD